jgi:hypothetical protein
MSTGSFENWAGTIADIGPIYPFEGTEFLLWVVGMALWILWHVKQARIEKQQFDEEIERFGSKEKLRKLISKEDPEHP